MILFHGMGAKMALLVATSAARREEADVLSERRAAPIPA